MFRKPRTVFFLLLILTVVLVVIDLPEKYRVNFTVGPIAIDREINPPVINIPRLNIYKPIITHLGLDLSGGTHVVLEADMSNIDSADRDGALASAKEIIDRRVNFFGLTEPVVQTAVAADSYRIIVELPGVTDVDQAVGVIGQTAQLEFREFTDLTEATAASTAAQLYDSTTPTGITGKDLRRAALSFSTTTGEPEVAIEFTSEGAVKFAEVTKRLTGKPLPIFLDNLLLSAPVVREEISGGQSVITGGFSQEDANTLALQLNAGALPVPVHVIEKRVIGATLGTESVAKSIRAGFVGLVIVAGFMIANYGFLGLISVFGLFLYGLISFALIRLIPITLTLPGIAGLILSIGMAVDSNILIFERYKEELRDGKPSGIAMELAFGKAWDSIRDANVTTLLTCLILYNPGNWDFLPSSGMVRGFAVTLFMGVLVSLFTGIVVTRTFIRVLYRGKKYAG